MTTNTSQRFFIYQYKYAKNGNSHECTTTVALTSASKFFLYSLTWHHFEDPRILLLKVGMKRLCNDLRLLRPNVIVSSRFKYLSTLLVETNGMFYEVSNGGHTEWLNWKWNKLIRSVMVTDWRARWPVVDLFSFSRVKSVTHFTCWHSLD